MGAIDHFQFMDAVKEKMGASAFISLYSKINTRQEQSKKERKQQEVEQAILEPMEFAKVKQLKNRKKSLLKRRRSLSLRGMKPTKMVKS